MDKKPWTSQDDALLEANSHLTCKQLGQMLGRTRQAVHARFKNLGITKPNLYRISDEKKARLVALYPNTKNHDIAKQLDISISAVTRLAGIMKLRKSAEHQAKLKKVFAKNCVNTRFGAGHKPWNAGQKGLYTSDSATKFKKGQTPKNALPIGSSRVNIYGFVEVKISRNQWERLHRLVWQRLHGKIPKKHQVLILDQSQPYRCNNLQAISLSESAKMNHPINRYPPELAKSVMQLAQLKASITKNERIKAHE